LKTVKTEFGKTEKDPVKPVNFEPGYSSFDASAMKDMKDFRKCIPKLCQSL